MLIVYASFFVYNAASVGATHCESDIKLFFVPTAKK